MIERDQTFFDLIYDIFFDVTQKRPESVNFRFSEKIDLPQMHLWPELEIVMPLPKTQNDKYVFEGIAFENNEYKNNLWSLFLASIYRLAAHVAVSDYKEYYEWHKNKTKKIAYHVIDFIEDVVVDSYLLEVNPQAWGNINKVHRELQRYYETETAKREKRCNEGESWETYCQQINLRKIDQIKEEISIKRKENDHKGILAFADLLYKNRELLPNAILPYCEHHGDEQKIEFQNSFQIEPHGSFKESISRLDELWESNTHSKTLLLKRYDKHLKNLNLDEVLIPTGDIQMYHKIRAKTLPMLRRIRDQIHAIPNIVDEPKTVDIGELNMQYAIQAIASENAGISCFDRSEERRAQEAWAILVDSSASMNLVFDKIREFTLCICESADQLSGNSNAWALYTFGNTFSILKDFNEKYTQEVKARIGGLKTSGLSHLPDALELTHRILAEDQRERKYIFVITDGHPSGYENIQKRYEKAVKTVEMSGVCLIAIGLSKKVSRDFSNSARGKDLRQLVANFITAYRTAASNM